METFSSSTVHKIESFWIPKANGFNWAGRRKKNEGDYFTSARSFPLITEKFQIKQTFTKIEKNNNSIQLTSTPQESIHLNLTYFCLHDLHICLIIPRFYIKEYWRLGNRTRLLWFFIRISLKTFLPYAGSFCTLL